MTEIIEGANEICIHKFYCLPLALEFCYGTIRNFGYKIISTSLFRQACLSVHPFVRPFMHKMLTSSNQQRLLIKVVAYNSVMKISPQDLTQAGHPHGQTKTWLKSPAMLPGNYRLILR